MNPFPDVEELYQKLVTDPYNLSFDQIAELTDYQIEQILCRPERKRRRAASTPGKYGSYREWFWDVWRSRGWTDRQIETRWREKVARGEVRNG